MKKETEILISDKDNNTPLGPIIGRGNDVLLLKNIIIVEKVYF